MAKLLSKYLKKEFEVNFFETDINGQPTTIISHDSLEDIILNQISSEVGVRYDKAVEHISDEHCVVKCTITDSTGRRVQSLGESVPFTLNTEIAKTIPCIMAEIRAFDRAAIRYLNFPGKVYSNEEGVNADEKKCVDIQKETIVDPSQYEIPNEGFTLLPEEAEHDPKEKSTITSQPIPETQNSGSVTKAMPAKEDAKSRAGKIVINFGKFEKNPQTVAEICDNADDQQKKWIDFVITKMKPSNDEKIKQVAALKYYMEHKGA